MPDILVAPALWDGKRRSADWARNIERKQAARTQHEDGLLCAACRALRPIEQIERATQPYRRSTYLPEIWRLRHRHLVHQRCDRLFEAPQACDPGSQRLKG